MSEKKFNLNEHSLRLLMDEPFFTSISRRIEKRESSAIPTAGVRVREDGYFELVYNSKFFEQLTDDQRSGVLIHEFYHLVFEHLTGRMPDDLKSVMKEQKGSSEQRQDFKLWNIATDLSINQLIGEKRLPPKCCFPGNEPFEDFPLNLNAEQYYDLLKQKQEQEKQDEQDGKGKGPLSKMLEDPKGAGQFDEHDWDNAESGAAQEIAQERLKEILRDAVNESTKSNSWGTVTAQCRKDIIKSISSKIDWRKVLRYFIKTSQRSDKRSTVKRINKRYAYIHPGNKVKRHAKIAISIDQSGSVSDKMLTAFYAELNKLSQIATFTVVPFDTEVDEGKVYTWKRGENRKVERVLYGGTCFNAPTNYVNERNFDGHIVLTDMCAPKPVKSNCQRMWVVPSEYASRPYFKTNERIVQIDC